MKLEQLSDQQHPVVAPQPALRLRRFGWRLGCAAMLFTLTCISACVGAELGDPAQVDAQAKLNSESAMAGGSWSDSERRLLRSMSLAGLPKPTADWRNPYIGDARAVRLGERLFNDPRLSGDQTFACATCHQAERAFQDGLPLAAGRKTLARNTPSLVGVSANQWWYWDGRKDSLWSQALEPLEARDEMGGSRGAIVNLMRTDPDYQLLFSQVFGALPALPKLDQHSASPLADQGGQRRWAALPETTRQGVNTLFVQVGQAIAAYEASLQHTPSAFDCFVDAVLADIAPMCDFDAAAERGLRTFISGAANCVSCHSGPLFSDRSFRNVGTMAGAGGRQAGVQRLLADPFNCEALDLAVDCSHLRLAGAVEVQRLQVGALRTPSLRNVANTGPYMHDGRFATLAEVVEHYRKPPPAAIHELAPIPGLSAEGVKDLVRFLESLSGNY